MRIIRVFPQRTSYTPDDELAFVGDPPFPSLIPEADEVNVSVTFTWDIAEGYRLRKAWFETTGLPTAIGGPAIEGDGRFLGEFEPGRYLKPGFTITTRGCPRNCWFCFVPGREGRLRTLPIRPGHIVLDNNLLAAPLEHVDEVFEMLKAQNRRVSFQGGLDARLFDAGVAERIRDLSIYQVFFAYDSPASLEDLGRAAKLLSFLPRSKLRCYVLVGFEGDTVDAAESRARAVWDLGFLPFPMYYRSEHNGRPPSTWCRWLGVWLRPWRAHAHMKEIMKILATEGTEITEVEEIMNYEIRKKKNSVISVPSVANEEG